MKVGGEEGGVRSNRNAESESRPRLSMPAEKAGQHGIRVNTLPACLMKGTYSGCETVHTQIRDSRHIHRHLCFRLQISVLTLII